MIKTNANSRDAIGVAGMLPPLRLLPSLIFVILCSLAPQISTAESSKLGLYAIVIVVTEYTGSTLQLIDPENPTAKSMTFLARSIPVMTHAFEGWARKANLGAAQICIISEQDSDAVMKPQWCRNKRGQDHSQRRRT